MFQIISLNASGSLMVVVLSVLFVISIFNGYVEKLSDVRYVWLFNPKHKFILTVFVPFDY